MPWTTKLVGRSAELADLEKELHRASRGEFRCVLVSADPGIGKTRLAAELLARNRRRTIELKARAYPLARTVSFSLWAEALDRYLRDLPADKVKALCGGFLEDLAGLLRSAAAAHGSAPTNDAPRFRVFEGLAVLVRNLAARAPVVVMLDDVHHADGSSWEALNYLAHNLPEARVLVVATVRPAELAEQPVATDLVLGLKQEGMLEKLVLGPLELEEVAELAEACLGRQAPGRLVTWLSERSQGNPLFVLGLLKALLDEGADLTVPVLRHLPEDLAERVTSRLKKLDEPAIATLEMLAVLGRPVDLTALSVLSEQPLERLGEILERLVRTRLVAEEEHGRELTYEIIHPLVQEAVYQGTGGARRRALHRLAARTLLASERVAEAAEHFSRSADAGDDEAIEALREAVRQAEGREAYEEALTMLGALVELLPPGDVRWLEVLDTMSQAGWVVDDRAEMHAARGIKVMRALDSVLQASSSPALRATVKLRLATFLIWGPGESEMPEADRLLNEACALFDQAGDRGGSLLAALGLAWSRGICRDYEGMADLACRVADEAEAAGDLLVEMQARLAVGFGCDASGAYDVSKDALRRTIAIARENGSSLLLSVALGLLAVVLAREGGLEKAFLLLDEAKEASPDWQERSLIPVAETIIHWTAGDFRAALVSTSRTPSPPGSGMGKVRAIGTCFGVMAAVERDRLAEAQRYATVARFAFRDGDWAGGAGFSLWADVAIAWREGRISEALESLRGAAATKFLRESCPGPLVDLSEMAAQAGRPDVAAEAMRGAEDVARRIDRELYRALADLAAAWAELAFSREAEAAQRAQRAHEVFARLGYRAHEGRALDVLGRALSSTNQKEAIAAFEQAVATFEACGATWRAQRSLKALRGLGNPGRRAATALLGPSSLSRREREVARLAAQGLTSRQVAERLVISERTVETHLSKIYVKLHVDSKLDLVHRAAEFVF